MAITLRLKSGKEWTLEDHHGFGTDGEFVYVSEECDASGASSMLALSEIAEITDPESVLVEKIWQARDRTRQNATEAIHHADHLGV